MRIAIGCDEAAFELKEVLRSHVVMHDFVTSARDFGVYRGECADYPDIALEVAHAISCGNADRGILLCGTGLGMAIAANKVPGIRAATCHDVYSAERAQKSNNAQIITLGARVIGPEAAKIIVSAYLRSSFAGGSSARKIDKIAKIEAQHLITQ